LPWETDPEHAPGVPAASPPAAPTPPPAQRRQNAAADASMESSRSELIEIRGRIHRRLLERLNLANLEALDRDQVTTEIRRAVHDLLARETVPLNFEEREDLVIQVLDEIFGLGPLEPLLKDPEISDILINTHKQVIVERHGKLEMTDVRFKDERHLLQIIDRIVSS